MKATKKMIADAIRVLELSASSKRVRDSSWIPAGDTELCFHVSVLDWFGAPHEHRPGGRLRELVSDAYSQTPGHRSMSDSAKQSPIGSRERRADYAEAALRMSEGWLPAGWERA